MSSEDKVFTKFSDGLWLVRIRIGRSKHFILAFDLNVGCGFDRFRLFFRNVDG